MPSSSSIVWLLDFQIVLIQPVEECLFWLVSRCVASLQPGDWAVKDQMICILGGLVTFWAHGGFDLFPPVLICCSSAVPGPDSVCWYPLFPTACRETGLALSWVYNDIPSSWHVVRPFRSPSLLGIEVFLFWFVEWISGFEPGGVRGVM